VTPRRGAAPYDPGPARRAVPRDRGAADVEAGAPRSVPERGPSVGVPSARPRAPYTQDRDSTQPTTPRSDVARPRRDDRTYAPRERAPYQPPAGYRMPERSRERPVGPAAAPERPRAVPRGGEAPPAYGPPTSPRGERSAPPPSYGPPRSPRGERSAPPPSYGPPRSPRGERSAPPPSYGSPRSPRGERSAPPPSAAPSSPRQGQPAARPRGRR
jgi:hypothetical protein